MTSPTKSNQFEFVGLVAGTKFWSLRLDFVAKMVSSHDATSPCDLLQGLVAGTSPIVCADLKSQKERFHSRDQQPCKFTGSKGTVHIKALANEDTLLRTQCCRHKCLPARATFAADTNFASGTQKMFLIWFRNILCPQQMFPSLRSPRNIMGNNVSATMCPRLLGP